MIHILGCIYSEQLDSYQSRKFIKVETFEGFFINIYLESVNQVCRRGGRRILQIFQKLFRSPGDHRPKYFMAQ